MTTDAPAAASAVAMPAPMPLEAPVTTATFPVSLLILFPSFFLFSWCKSFWRRGCVISSGSDR